MISSALFEALESVLGERLVGVARVGGGCIHNGARVETADGRVFFLKWNERASAAMFEAEVDGLKALRAAAHRGGDVAGLRVPSPESWSAPADRPAWLLMEHVEPGPRAPGFEERLGRGLAALHAAAPRTDFGWRRDNWIGSLEQPNPPSSDWPAFWRDARIRPHLERARARGFLRQATLDALVDVVPSAFDGAVRPSLLHGDLWSGNVLSDARGEPVLIDPAVYVGHAEVDLAMTELFGGFGARFYDAYREAAPIDPSYEACRRHLYQLYYLLVHLNLFGGSYERGCVDAASRVVAALS